jgi:diacylglycerol kinase family enzyme/membrane-associated phospholipid phosphatase
MDAERATITAGGAEARATRRGTNGRPAEGTGVATATRAVVFANPVAPNAHTDRLHAALELHLGAGAYRVVETTGDDDFAATVDRELKRTADAGGDLAIAAGGDGTVSLVAERLHRLGGEAKGMALAIVPCGTANILARELEIPSGIEEAVALAAARPQTQWIDGLSVGDRLVLTQVGIGLDAFMIRDTSREAQQRFKRLSYLATLARRVAGHRSQRYRIRVDGRMLSVRAWQMLIANASTLGAKPFVWGPHIDPADGIADLCIFRVERGKDLLGLAWAMLTGRQDDSPHTTFVRVHKEVTVECHRKLPVQGDGELLGRTPVHAVVTPHAVPVVVPLPKEKHGNGKSNGNGNAKVSGNGNGNGHGTSNGTRAPARDLRSRWERARKRIGAADTSAYLALNKLQAGALVDRALVFCSRILDWGEVWALVTLLAVWRDPRHLERLPFLVLPPLWLAMLAVNYPIKSLFKRRRPFLVHERARLIGRKPTDSSFPSGHTAAAIAGAVMLTPSVPHLAPLLWGYALVVSFSRVYLGVHFPADVVAGGALGAALAVLLGAAWGGLWKVLFP